MGEQRYKSKLENQVHMVVVGAGGTQFTPKRLTGLSKVLLAKLWYFEEVREWIMSTMRQYRMRRRDNHPRLNCAGRGNGALRRYRDVAGHHDFISC
jgi:hypothetical protein